MLTTESPVIKLGPGGDFVTAYCQADAPGSIVARVESGLSSILAALAARAGRLLLAESVLGSHQAVVAASCQSLAGLSRAPRTPQNQSQFHAVRALALAAVNQEAFDESHSQAAPHSPAHPRLAGPSRLFADHAGARR